MADSGAGKPSPKRAAIYARVSTAAKFRQGEPTGYEQNPAVQEQPLRDLIAQRELMLHKVDSDRASGATERRPGVDALMADARWGAFDVVVAFRLDRFARNVKQLVLAPEDFRKLGIDFISYQEALDTTTPIGEAVFAIIAAMARLERRERVQAGIPRAQLRGGRPPG